MAAKRGSSSGLGGGAETGAVGSSGPGGGVETGGAGWGGSAGIGLDSSVEEVTARSECGAMARRCECRRPGHQRKRRNEPARNLRVAVVFESPWAGWVLAAGLPVSL